MRPVARASATPIVIVEDDAAIADALAARLRAEGFAVEGAPDGVAGVERREIHSHVAAIRRKLGADALRTVQGIGYAFGTPRP
jgi:DNA-binding response OmpR family regulator